MRTIFCIHDHIYLHRLHPLLRGSMDCPPCCNEKCYFLRSAVYIYNTAFSLTCQICITAYNKIWQQWLKIISIFMVYITGSTFSTCREWNACTKYNWLYREIWSIGKLVSDQFVLHIYWVVTQPPQNNILFAWCPTHFLSLSLSLSLYIYAIIQRIFQLLLALDGMVELFLPSPWNNRLHVLCTAYYSISFPALFCCCINVRHVFWEFA